MKHQHWFKVWQDRLLSDPKFMTLRDSAVGMLFKAWMIAARVADAGKLEMTASEFMSNYSHNDYRAAKSDLSTLLSRGYLKSNSRLGLQVLGWEESQETPAAARVRRMRERNKRVTVTQHVTPIVTGEAEADVEAEAETNKQQPGAAVEVPKELEQIAFRVFGSVPVSNLAEAVKHHEAEWIKEAMLKAEAANVRRWGYANTILQSWAKSGKPKQSGGPSPGIPTRQKIQGEDPDKFSNRKGVMVYDNTAQ